MIEAQPDLARQSLTNREGKALENITMLGLGYCIKSSKYGSTVTNERRSAIDDFGCIAQLRTCNRLQLLQSVAQST